MITTLIIMYILVGLAVSHYEYGQSKTYLEDIKNYYPLPYRILALGIASACVIAVWPYVLYEIIRDKS